MHDSEVRDERVVHVLPEERGGVEGVEGDSVGPVVCESKLAFATHRKVRQ